MSKFQITADKNKNSDHPLSYGDIVIWREDSDLEQDCNGNWFDRNCRDRGIVVNGDAMDLLLGVLPSSNGEIVIIDVTILERNSSRGS